MKRLFITYPSDKLWLLTSYDRLAVAASYEPLPNPAQVTSVRNPKLPRMLSPLLFPISQSLTLHNIIKRGVDLVRKHKIELIITAPWSDYCIAAHEIQRTVGVPLAVYMMDDWLWDQLEKVTTQNDRRRNRKTALAYTNSTHRPSASFLGGLLLRLQTAQKLRRYQIHMPLVLQQAAKVWSITEYMSDFLRYVFHVQSEVLLPFIDVREFRQLCITDTIKHNNEIKLVFTGNIYEAQLDALQNLVNLIRSGVLMDTLRRPVRLQLYTNTDAATLKSYGLYGDSISSTYIHPSHIPHALASADALFLPFSFSPNVEHLIRTSFPTKAAEYFSSGVPILVHGPSYSSIARYFRQHEAGVVVTENSLAALQQGMIQLFTDEHLRRDITSNAFATALRAHDSYTLVAQVHNTLSEIVRQTVHPSGGTSERGR